MNNFDFDDDLPFSPAYEEDNNNKEKEKKENENKVNSDDIENFFSNGIVKEESKTEEANALNINLENNNFQVPQSGSS